MPDWPPDVFAITSMLLQRSGAYRFILANGGLSVSNDLTMAVYGEVIPDPDWEECIAEVAFDWREAWAMDAELPAILRTWWGEIVNNENTSLNDIIKNRKLCEAILGLHAAADEACVGVGVPMSIELNSEDEVSTYLQLHALELLGRVEHSSLCINVHASRVRVLPKMRTSRMGLTIRSLSNHLCAIPGTEVQCIWKTIPREDKLADKEFLNLLIFPYPLELKPSQFQQTRSFSPSAHAYGTFKVVPSDDEETPAKILKQLIRQAKSSLGELDGVVLPEIAVSKEQCELLRKVAKEEKCFLIAGVNSTTKNSTTGSTTGENCVHFYFPSDIPANDIDKCPLRDLSYESFEYC